MPSKRFRSIAGVRRFVARILQDLEQGAQSDIDLAKAMFMGAKLLADLIDSSETEKRLRNLERRLYEKPTPPTSAQINQ